MLKLRMGTSVRNQLMKSARHGGLLDMMYVANDGSISQRRIKVLMVGEGSIWAYCHLRKSRRTFLFDNILALVPIITKENMVI